MLVSICTFYQTFLCYQYITCS